MGEVRPLPRTGDVFVDVRGEDRTLRISHHDDTGVVVLSLWAGGLCRASFRLPLADAPRLIALLGGSGSGSGAGSGAGSAAPGPVSADPDVTGARPTIPHAASKVGDSAADDRTAADAA